MKQFALAALIGSISAVQLESQYRPDPVQSPWAAKSKPGDTTAITGAYFAHDQHHSDYERNVPAMYTAESDDRLMNSLIAEYAVEGQTDGAPNGKFFLTKAGARGVAGEVAETHFGFRGEKKEAWLKDHFEHAFKHVDTLKEGFFPIVKGPVFLRNLVDSVEISNQLQLQINEEGALTNEGMYRPPNAVVAPWSAKPEPAPVTTLTGAYHTGLNYGADREYSRVVPDRYTAESDDRLMNSLIDKYSLESKVDGAPSGHFYLDQAGMRAVSAEVVGTHLGFHGKK